MTCTCYILRYMTASPILTENDLQWNFFPRYFCSFLIRGIPHFGGGGLHNCCYGTHVAHGATQHQSIWNISQELFAGLLFPEFSRGFWLKFVYVQAIWACTLWAIWACTYLLPFGLVHFGPFGLVHICCHPGPLHGRQITIIM